MNYFFFVAIVIISVYSAQATTFIGETFSNVTLNATGIGGAFTFNTYNLTCDRLDVEASNILFSNCSYLHNGSTINVSSYNYTIVGISDSGLLTPNITAVFPVILDYTIDEGSSYDFEINVTDNLFNDNISVNWFKDAILQLTEVIISGGSSIWNWITGMAESGNHNIEANISNKYNDTASIRWNVTVSDTFPVPFVPSFGVSSGSFEYSIPLSCIPSGSVVSPFVFEFFYGVNGSSVNSSLGFNSSSGLYAFDISNYAYGSNFSFSCRVISPTGVSDSVYSGVFTKINKNNFYLFSPEETAAVTANTPYLLGMVAEIDNSIGATLYANVADCNGDGVFDHSFSYAGDGVTSARETFACVNNAGKKKTTIGMIIYKNNTNSWESIGCNLLGITDNYCIVYKTYEVNVI